MEFQSEFKHFHSKNAFENVVCKMSSILSLPQCVSNYIMAGRAFVVAKEVFIMETVVF